MLKLAGAEGIGNAPAPTKNESLSLFIKEPSLINDHYKVMGFDEHNNNLLDLFSQDAHMVASISKTTNSNSSKSTTTTSRELKGEINFKALPKTLHMFKWHIIIIFFLLLFIVMAMLFVNIFSKISFINNLDFFDALKQSETALSSARLSILYLYTIVNAFDGKTAVNFMNSTKLIYNNN